MNGKNTSDYILNYYPTYLDRFLGSKIIKFRDQDLKRDFLIHLVSSLLTKYFFTKENEFRLHSSILRSIYGKWYNYYMDYLIESGIIIVYKNHQKGRRSRQYQLSNSVVSSNIVRYLNGDEILLKKRKNWIDFNLRSNNSPICSSIRERLISDLYSVKIQDELACLELLSKDHTSPLELERDNYAVDCIRQEQIYFHFDDYGRFHTPFTILPKQLRNNCLTIEDVDISEVDIPNSQPLFLLKLIHLNSHIQIEEGELELFSTLVRDGNFYQHLSKVFGNKNIKEVKKLVFEILFGQNNPNSLSKIFCGFFPTIFNFLKTIKRERGDYRWVSHQLQKLESDFIFNRVIKKIYARDPNIKLFTVHDSIFCRKDRYDFVLNIFLLEIKKEFDF